MMQENYLPASWVENRLGDFVHYQKGKKPKSVSSNMTSTYSIPYVNIKAFEKGVVDEYTNGEGCVFCEHNEFLMVWDGARSGYVGRALKGALGSTLVKIKFPGVNMNYAYYYLQSKYVEINTNAKGTGIPHVDPELVWNYRFPLPPLLEQHRIVAKIEELFSELDKGIETLKTAKEQLKIYRQAVLKYAFEGEFTATWRKDNPDYSATDELKKESSQRLKKAGDKKSIYYKKIAHDFKFTQHERISSWAKGTLDKLVYIAARIGWRGLKKDEYTQTGPLFLSVHSLNHGKYVAYTEAFHVNLERYVESPEIQLQEGDVLLCKDGAGIGKIGIIKDLPDKATVNSSLLVIRGMNILNQEFLFYLFSGPVLQKIVFERITGSATPHLFQNDISKFELLIPPYKEQLQIVQEIESRLSVCDKIEESIEQGLQQAEALRQSILKKAFEGKLVPQDPNDEPASELLERIKAERAAAQPKKQTNSKKK